MHNKILLLITLHGGERKGGGGERERERLNFEVGEVGEFTIETKNAGIGTLTIRVHGIKGAFKITAEPVKDDDPRTLRAHYDRRRGIT